MVNYHLFKCAFGSVLVLDALAVMHNHVRLFGPQSDERSMLHTPARLWAVWSIWLVAALGLVLGVWPLACSLTLTVLFRLLYISPRLRSPVAGRGALGLMAYTLALFVAQVETSCMLGCDATLVPLLLLQLALTLGTIMCASVVHKSFLGYRHKEGLEYALVNPLWGRFYYLFRRLPATSKLFAWQNHGVLATELAAGVLLLFPQTQAVGAALLMLTFGVATLLVRIGYLGPLMVTAGLLFLPELPWHTTEVPTVLWQAGPWVQDGCAAVIYLLCVRIVLGQLDNVRRLHTKLVLPAKVDAWLTRLEQWYPVGCWAVFTRHITDFFVSIALVPVVPTEAKQPLYDADFSHPKNLFVDARRYYRFASNEEALILLTLFAAVKFAQSRQDLQAAGAQIARYARTLVPQAAWQRYHVDFGLFLIDKQDRFIDRHVLDIRASLSYGTASYARPAAQASVPA